jgi:predicted DNA-binding transcriptional regulator AlpA
MKKAIITQSETARRLSVSKTTLWRLAKRKDFPRKVYITTKKIGFIESELDEWIERSQVK